MARYAAGLKAWGYSDRSGFRYRLNDMLVEWNGLKVGPDEYEEKQPQLEPSKTTPDPEALRNPRPDQRNEVLVERLLPLNPFETAVAFSPTTTYAVTVANVGGINVFVLDGVNNPTLSFIRGNTYIFDLSDNTVSGHPLAFKDGSGNSYTTGVTTVGAPANPGSKVTIVVDPNAPSSLRYYCTVHGNAMGNTISVSGTSSTNTNLTVYEPNHGRGNGSTVRFRSAAGVDGISKATIEAAAGYTITVVDANTYTVVVSGTVLVGNQRGGGGKATAGPVSLGV